MASFCLSATLGSVAFLSCTWKICGSRNCAKLLTWSWKRLNFVWWKFLSLARLNFKYLLSEYLHTDCNSPNTLVSHKLNRKKECYWSRQDLKTLFELDMKIQYTSIWPEVDVSGYVLVCWGKAIYQRLFVLRINIPKLPIIVSLIWEWVINGPLRCKYHSVLVQRVSSQLSAPR